MNIAKPFFVTRESIPAIYSVKIGEEIHNLGILKDFRSHLGLKNVLPETSRPSFSWVHLKNEEVLNPHVHPIASMIIVCKGDVMSLGDSVVHLKEGDVFFIPPNTVHGFKGLNQGFWGLSIQFEKRGLYEDINDPLASFVEKKEEYFDANKKKSNFVILLDRNQLFAKKFAAIPLFTFLNDKKNQTETIRENFLSFFQVWSNSFQRMVLLRSALCYNVEHQEIADQHLQEEFGHNSDFVSKNSFKDPVLQAVSDWFPWKMFSLSEEEKIVLVHLVIEASATIFYEKIPSFIARSSFCDKHFAIHQKIDESHENLGNSLLEKLDNQIYDRLSIIQREGWEMLGQVFERIYVLLKQGVGYDI